MDERFKFFTEKERQIMPFKHVKGSFIRSRMQISTMRHHFGLHWQRLSKFDTMERKETDYCHAVVSLWRTTGNSSKIKYILLDAASPVDTHI